MIETAPSPRFSSLLFCASVALVVLLFSPARTQAQLPVTDDSYTQQGAPNANNGGATTVIVRGSTTADSQ